MRVVAWALLSLLFASCAPLTRPPAAGTAPDEDASPPATSVLQAYLSRRSQEAPGPPTRPHIAVLRFTDESGFRQGIWDLDIEMARLMSKRMANSPDWQVVPQEVVEAAMAHASLPLTSAAALELGAQVMADIIVLGTIREFNMGRFSVGDPLLGGYKSYQGIAGFTASALRVSDGGRIATVTATRETGNRDLGLDLFGKPREQDVQFSSLSEIAFDSQEFRATVLGQATEEAMTELLSQLALAIRPGELHLGGRTPAIVSADGEIYINIGSENGVRVGYVFAVFPGPGRTVADDPRHARQLGTVVVETVIGDRLSRVRMVEPGGVIAAGDLLQLQVPGD